MDVNSLKNEFNKIEKKLFEKQNIRFLANIYFRLIDDVVDSTNKSLEKQKMIEKYISELDKIYLDSFVEKKGKEKSLLTLSQIEKYSILKYFMIIKKDFLIDFAADELLKYYSKELEESFEIQDIKIINILTKEKIELTKNRKKLFLKLLSSLLKSEQLNTNYSLDLETKENDIDCIIANPENQFTKTKK